MISSGDADTNAKSVATPISYRRLTTWAEYVAAEHLQREVWQMADWRDVVPAHLLVTVQKNGGIVLGAFTPAQRLVGFVFSFLGRADDEGSQLQQCSHLLAVLPEFRGKEIGARLKFAQRDAARAQGVTRMTWTYDPLLALNAHLNLARLGGSVRQYIVEAYGEMADGLNVGLPSDRFLVEWRFDAPVATPRRTWRAWVAAGACEIFDLAFDAEHLPHIQRVRDLCGEALVIEIPSDLNALKAATAQLALEWRLQTRAVFQRAFAAGYVATDLLRETRNGVRRAAYLLVRQPGG